jgi:hypothetical protein
MFEARIPALFFGNRSAPAVPQNSPSIQRFTPTGDDFQNATTVAGAAPVRAIQGVIDDVFENWQAQEEVGLSVPDDRYLLSLVTVAALVGGTFFQRYRESDEEQTK